MFKYSSFLKLQVFDASMNHPIVFALTTTSVCLMIWWLLLLVVSLNNYPHLKRHWTNISRPIRRHYFPPKIGRASAALSPFFATTKLLQFDPLTFIKGTRFEVEFRVAIQMLTLELQCGKTLEIKSRRDGTILKCLRAPSHSPDLIAPFFKFAL